LANGVERHSAEGSHRPAQGLLYLHRSPSFALGLDLIAKQQIRSYGKTSEIDAGKDGRNLH
jgi:hypothetical protein